MKAIKTYPTTVEADLARIALDADDIPSVVVGTGVTMEGGLAGVQLLVPEDQVPRALSLRPMNSDGRPASEFLSLASSLTFSTRAPALEIPSASRPCAS